MNKTHRSIVRIIQKSGDGRPTHGVLVGTYRGELAADLLRSFPSLHLYLADPYRAHSPGESYYENHAEGKHTQQEWDDIFMAAHDEALAAGAGRFSFQLEESARAALAHARRSLGFVILNRDHGYGATRDAIEVWRPKTDLLLGTGYNARHEGGRWGVKRAVDEAFGVDSVDSWPRKVWVAHQS